MRTQKNRKKYIFKRMKEKSGITLIALVITIIVLLILAGVTIAALTGENGILTRAADSKRKTEQAEEDELRKLTQAEAATNLENTTHTDNSTGKEVTVTIPAGFAVSQVEGENAIADGLVIIDKSGNEFVWVPVEYDREADNFAEIFVRREGYYNGSPQTYLDSCGEADSTGTNQYLEKNGMQETETTKQEAMEMYASVKEHGGFYIGRYETGNDGSGNAVVRRGANVYNNIPWSANGNNMQETSGTTGGAVELARNFDIANHYSTVTSTLIYGVQWDAVMRWMENIPNPNVEGKTYIQDSTGMGYYGYSVPPTTTGYYAVNNIYDLAGNVWEWTMESYSTNYRVYRGGSCNNTASKIPVSKRDDDGPSVSYVYFGFRITLYL